MKKHRARTRYQHTQLLSHKSTYNKLPNSLKKTIAKNKFDAFEQKLAKLTYSVGSLWKEIKKLLQIKISSAPQKKPDNKFTFSNSDKAEVLYRI